MTDFKEGDLVWYDGGGGFPLPAVVQSMDESGTTIQVSHASTSETVSLTGQDCGKLKARRTGGMGSGDLTQLEDLCDGSILYSLKTRYDRNNIYTNIGSILLSVNPYRNLDIYSVEAVHRYNVAVPGTMTIHLFGLASAAYNQMIKDSKKQVIIVSGESGSGKTEACKLLVQYFAVAAATGPIQPMRTPTARNTAARLCSEKLLDTSPILESFGNAKTLRNDNSSRFGKCIQLFFKMGKITGGEISQYLLERSRVVMQANGERNYHIFYEMLAGLKQDLKEKFGLLSVEKYFYLNQGNAIEIRSRNAREDFARVVSALDLLGFTPDFQQTIWRILAAILHLGNIYFRKHALSQFQEGVAIGQESEMRWAAYLLQLDPSKLSLALTTKSTSVAADKVSMPLDIDRALDARDALAKALYTQLFAWLVKQINKVVQCTSNDNSLSLLDFYGFEHFTVNSLEQLCINLANERLHGYFVDVVFRQEQAEYRKENIEWGEMLGEKLDNHAVVNLMIKRPHGIFHLLDDESSFPKGTDESFLQKCHYNHMDSTVYAKAKINSPEFMVRHYAANVWYQVPGFLDKNRELMRSGLVELLRSSQNVLIAKMFAEKCPSDKGQHGSKANSLVSQFSESLDQLLNTLNKTSPLFVRCLKPNNDKLPAKFDLAVVMEQLRHLGVTETVKIRKLGYPIRLEYSLFANRYRCLGSNISKNCDAKELVGQVLALQNAQYSVHFQLGKRNVFLREHIAEKLERARERSLNVAATTIQKRVRGYLARQKYLKLRAANVELQLLAAGSSTPDDHHLDVVPNPCSSSGNATSVQNQCNGRDPAPSVIPEYAVASVGHLDMPTDLDRLLSSFESLEDKFTQCSQLSRVPQSSQVLPLDKRNAVPCDLAKFPFSDFAHTYFKGHNWQMRRDPILSPFLVKESEEDFQASIAIFKLILRFMNDIHLTSAQEFALANYISAKGVEREDLRDEIFVQLANQVYKNPNTPNAERGWKLMAACASLFRPSRQLYKPLLHFVRATATATGSAIVGLVRQKLMDSAHGSDGVRLQSCSLLEWSSLTHRAKVAANVTMPDGCNKLCQIDSWVTAGEMAQCLLRESHVSAPQGWTVVLRMETFEFALAAEDYICDAIAYAESPNNLGCKQPPFAMIPDCNKHLKLDACKGDSALYAVPGKGPQHEEGSARNACAPPAPPLPFMPTKEKPTVATFVSPKYSACDISEGQRHGLPQPVLPREKSTAITNGVMQNRYPEPVYSAFSDYSTMSMASHVQRVPVPGRNGDVERYLDELFAPVLQDRHLDDAYDPHRIAASIKGVVDDTQFQLPAMMPQSVPNGAMMVMLPIGSNSPVIWPTHGEWQSQLFQGPLHMLPVPHMSAYADSNGIYATPKLPNAPDDSRIGMAMSGVPPQPIYNAPSLLLSPPHPSHPSLNGHHKKPTATHNGVQHEAAKPLHGSSQYTSLPTEVTESYYSSSGDESSVIPARRVNGDKQDLLIMGQMRPSNSKARYVPQQTPRRFESAPDDMEEPPVTHGIRDIVQKARENAAAAERMEWNLAQEMKNNSSFVNEPSHDREDSVLYAAGPQPTYAEVRERNGAHSETMIVMNDTVNSPTRGLFGRHYATEQQRIEQAALAKLRESTKELPPPLEGVKFKREARAAPVKPTRSDDLINYTAVPSVDQTASRQTASRQAVGDYTATEDDEWVPGADVLDDFRTTLVRKQEIVEVRERQEARRTEPLFAANVDSRAAAYPVEDYRATSAMDVDHYALFQMKEAEANRAKMLENRRFPYYFYKQPGWELALSKQGINYDTNNFALTDAWNPPMPWVFLPNEVLPDSNTIDLVFSQVMRDIVDRNIVRMRRVERVKLVELLKAFGLPSVDAWKTFVFTPAQKQEIISVARDFPLYFSAFYPVVEIRDNEYVAQFLGIHESGLRLIARSYANPDEPLCVMDYFGFEDIRELELSAPDQLTLHPHATHISKVQLRTEKAKQIKDFVDEFLYGDRHHGRHFVSAVADYVTTEPHFLSFRRGDAIQLLPQMQSDMTGSGLSYGRLGGAYGYFPTDYVEPIRGDADLPAPLAHGAPLDLQVEDEGQGVFFDTLDRNKDKKPEGKLTMMEFAMLYFRHDSKKSNEEEWTWRDLAELVKFTKTPLTASLLRLQNPEYNRLSVETFVVIMQYMQDYPLRKHQSTTDCVYQLLNICHAHAPMRDEIYCQLMKQTTNNRSSQPDSAIRGWRLLSILTAFFDCSEVLKPYLYKYLQDAALDSRRVFHGTARVCLENLRKTMKYGGRKCVLNPKEVHAITIGKNLKRQIYHLPGGTKRVVNTTAVSVVEDIIRELCAELNVLSALEQQEFSLCYVVESDNSLKLLMNDDYILDVTTELENQRKDYFLLLKRTVWLHPLRLDNDLYINMMFFQVVPDYLEGLLIIMRTPDQISAATADEVATLAALLHKADTLSEDPRLDSHSIGQLLPRIIQNVRGLNPEVWVSRVTSKLAEMPSNMTSMQARTKFLDIVRPWPLFGSTFFYIMNVSDSRVGGESLLAVNQHGLQFVGIITHEVLLEFRLTEIMSAQSRAAPFGEPQMLELKVGNLLQQRSISLQTEQGPEISRLIGQYIYVDSQSRGLFGAGKSIY